MQPRPSVMSEELQCKPEVERDITSFSCRKYIFAEKLAARTQGRNAKGSNEDSCNLHNLLSTRAGMTLTSSARNEEAEGRQDEKSSVHRITFPRTRPIYDLVYLRPFLQTHPTWRIARYSRTLAMHEAGSRNAFFQLNPAVVIGEQGEPART